MDAMNWRERIDLDLEPRIKGAGVRVEEILRALGAGASIESLPARFPGLSRDDILACLAYAAEAINRAGFVEATRRGLADTEAGRLTDDDEVWREFDRELDD